MPVTFRGGLSSLDGVQNKRTLIVSKSAFFFGADVHKGFGNNTKAVQSYSSAEWIYN